MIMKINNSNDCYDDGDNQGNIDKMYERNNGKKW